MSRYLLFLSNGYGEDTIAASIIRELQARAPQLEIKAMPLVGHGTAYEPVGVPRLGPQELMPSGGLVNAGVQHLVRDLKAGLVRLTLQQIRHLRRNRSDVELVVAVGDTYPVLLGALFSRRPMVFVGTAKSNWFVPYAAAEAAIFRSCCARVFVRDEPTAATLRGQRVAAEWVGNAMMDCLDANTVDLGSDGKPIIGVLPGSREATYSDLPVLLEAMQTLGGEYHYAAALADSIEEARLAAISGWRLEGNALVSGEVRMTLARRALGTVLDASRLVLGQAGTANEQAAGLGRPIVAFESTGQRKLGWYRARQKGLLGDALRVVARDGLEIAAAAREILSDPQLYEHMAKTGRARMGPPGASARMADAIAQAARQNGVM